MASERTKLWLLASLAFTSLISLTDGSPLKVMSAPNLLRVGRAEYIFVECRDCTTNNVSVEINVLTHPARVLLVSTSVKLTKNTKFFGVVQITIPPEDFSQDLNTNQYVYLEAKFPDVELQKVVLVAGRSGYIYIKTHKTIYTPNSEVLYRMFAVKPRLEPVDADNNTDPIIVTEIVTPNGLIIEHEQFSMEPGIFSRKYKLGEMASPGLWKVVARFHTNRQKNFSAEFEVKGYENCSLQIKAKINNTDRTDKACEINNKIEYVYKVKIEDFTANLTTDIYTMRIEKVIQKGGDACELRIGRDGQKEKNCDVAPEGKLRTFLSYPQCRKALGLEKDKTYLIMGSGKDIDRDEEKQLYQYLLGERTWIEYWPTNEECQTQGTEHREACLGIEKLVNQLTIFGCLA